jgi:hypothetical protein
MWAYKIGTAGSGIMGEEVPINEILQRKAGTLMQKEILMGLSKTT